ncbi:MAG: hypothetical protein ABIO39_05945 [Caulobacteraceae bacterium]
MSSSTIVTASNAGEPSYDAMREAIEKNVASDADRELLIASMEHLQAVEGTEAFTSAYEHFVESAENHLPTLGPFITWLEAMLGA